MHVNFYQEDVNKAWQCKLVEVFYKLKSSINHGENQLRVPQFEITNSATTWGTYIGGEKPTITIARKLLNDFGIGAAEHVVSHEMAHMVVDKIFHMGDLKSHGEAFKKACSMLGIDAVNAISVDELRILDTAAEKRQRVVNRVKKLMALSESPEKEEAERALAKAHELMMRYNIKSLEERKSNDYFVRPIGPTWMKVPNYTREIVNLIHEYYFVNTILTYAGGWLRSGRRYEFFGTKENLDIAEYVFCCLLQQGESLWAKYRDEKKAKHGRVKGVFSKANFIEGVVAGYSSQLHAKNKMINKKLKEEQRKVNEEVVKAAANSDLNFFDLGDTKGDNFTKDPFNDDIPVSSALIWFGDKLMNEMYKKTYPNLKNHSYSTNGVGAGYNDGLDAGSKLRINQGISGSTKKLGKMLTA